MSAHTPGRWRIRFSRSGYPYQITADGGDDQKPGAVGTKVLRWGSFILPSSAEGLANARLIAAAPDLLAACKMVMGASIVCPEDLQSEVEACREAIRRAETGR